jgi:hypothetical protein
MPSDWRRAKSLDVLGDEIEAKYPGTTVWDIGDEDHQDSWSDHNPNECCDVVCAIDVLADGGVDLGKFVAHLITNPHPNLRYVIYNRKIYQRKNGFRAEDYNGKNAHKTHVHVSVGNGPDGRSTEDYDSTAGWGIANLGQPGKPSKPTNPTESLGDKMPTLRRGAKGQFVRILQALLTAWGFKTSIDGIFGQQTERQVMAFQAKYAKPVDGIPGPITWNALLGVK